MKDTLDTCHALGGTNQLSLPLYSATFLCRTDHVRKRKRESMADQTRTHHEMISLDNDRDQNHPKARQMVKTATAVAAGGSLLVLSGLTLAGTVIALAVATPLLIIFSPVLVPAVITVVLIITGFLASGGFGIASITAFSWLYRYVTGSGSDQKIENARMKVGHHDTKYGLGVQHQQQPQSS